MKRNGDALWLGDLRIVPGENAVIRGRSVRRLEPKAMDVLLCLLDRRGEIVSIEEIMRQVWPNRVIEDSGVHQRVFQIRRALDDDARSPRYLESIPKRGYRLRHLNPSISSGASEESSQCRVAVLDLQDLSPDANLSWMGLGLSEELRCQIDGWPQFSVLPRAFSQGWQPGNPPRDIDVLLDGFVQGSGPQVSVHLNVVDTQRKSTIWTRTFEGEHENPLELQRQIAESIARFFGESTGGLPAPSRPEAYGAFLRLLNHRYFGSLDEHAYWLEKTLELDPDWHWGWGDLAVTWLRCASMLRDARLIDRARTIARTTPRSDPAAAILGLADFFLAAMCEKDCVRAESIARHLAASGWGYPYATLLACSGLYDHAANFFRQSAERKPYRPVMWEWLTIARANSGDWRGALDSAHHVERLFPLNAPNPPIVVSWAALGHGNLRDAGRLLARLKHLLAKQRAGTAQRRLTEVLGYYPLLFRIAEARGDRQTALAAADWFSNHGFGLHAGILYLRLGDLRAESALALADHRFDGFYSWVTTMMITPKLRRHPLIRAALETLGFSDAWRESLSRHAATLPESSHLRVRNAAADGDSR